MLVKKSFGTKSALGLVNAYVATRVIGKTGSFTTSFKITNPRQTQVQIVMNVPICNLDAIEIDIRKNGEIVEDVCYGEIESGANTGVGVLLEFLKEFVDIGEYVVTLSPTDVITFKHEDNNVTTEVPLYMIKPIGYDLDESEDGYATLTYHVPFTASGYYVMRVDNFHNVKDFKVSSLDKNVTTSNGFRSPDTQKRCDPVTNAMYLSVQDVKDPNIESVLTLTPIEEGSALCGTNTVATIFNKRLRCKVICDGTISSYKIYHNKHMMEYIVQIHNEEGVVVTDKFIVKKSHMYVELLMPDSKKVLPKGNIYVVIY